MQINLNISAIKAGIHLNRTESRLSKSTEKLSSGYKINHAADDAAGFSISRKMRTQIRALERSSQNSSDGISLLQTAEGSLNEVSAMLIRMKELSVQSANDTNSSDERMAIQKEMDQLLAEIDRISSDNDFNTKTMLNGDMGRKTITDTPDVSVISTSREVSNGSYKITVNKDPKQAVYEGGAISGFPSEDLEGSVIINGVVIDINKNEDTKTVINKLREGAALSGVELIGNGGGPDADGDPKLAGYTKASAEDNPLVFISREYGKDAKVEISVKAKTEEKQSDLAAALGLPEKMEEDDIPRGEDAEITLDEDEDSKTKFEKTATVKVSGDKALIRDNGGFEMEVKISPFATEKGVSDVAISVLDAGYITLQVGANTGNSFDISIDRIDTETLGIRGLSVGSHEEAEKSIERVDIAISRVSAERSKLGAFQNRLEYTILSTDETTENMTTALSRILDMDLADEMTEYSQQQLLSQAGTSVLARANERPQTIISLLQG